MVPIAVSPRMGFIPVMETALIFAPMLIAAMPETIGVRIVPRLVTPKMAMSFMPIGAIVIAVAVSVAVNRKTAPMPVFVSVMGVMCKKGMIQWHATDHQPGESDGDIMQ